MTDESEIQKASDLSYRRKDKEPKPVEEFDSDEKRRFYKAVPEKAWISQKDDIRVEINLV